MDPPDSGDDLVIKDGPVQDARELVLGEAERDQYAVVASPLALDRAEEAEAGLFDAEDHVGAEGASTDEHPATQVPVLPGVGGERKGKGKSRR